MTIIEINRCRTFTLEEARNVLPVIFKITRSHNQKVEALIERIDALTGTADDSLIGALENEVNQLIQDWQAKVQKLGAFPKGLWLVDFDTGDGYFCWKYPEPDIEFWHRYTDGFSKRVHVSQWPHALANSERLLKTVSSTSEILPSLD